MTRERFIEILVEEGIDPDAAANIWEDRPKDELGEPRLRVTARHMLRARPQIRAVYRRWHQVWKQYHYMEYLGMGAPRLRCSCGNEALTCGLLMARGLVQISDQPEMQLLGRTRDCARRTASGETIH